MIEAYAVRSYIDNLFNGQKFMIEDINRNPRPSSFINFIAEILKDFLRRNLVKTFSSFLLETYNS